jgi:hypothetical protein
MRPTRSLPRRLRWGRVNSANTSLSSAPTARPSEDGAAGARGGHAVSVTGLAEDRPPARRSRRSRLRHRQQNEGATARSTEPDRLSRAVGAADGHRHRHACLVNLRERCKVSGSTKPLVSHCLSRICRSSVSIMGPVFGESAVQDAEPRGTNGLRCDDR